MNEFPLEVYNHVVCIYHLLTQKHVLFFSLYNSDDLELENFVARNSQRMSLRLQSKRRPAENMLPLSPALKRSVPFARLV